MRRILIDGIAQRQANSGSQQGMVQRAAYSMLSLVPLNGRLWGKEATKSECEGLGGGGMGMKGQTHEAYSLQFQILKLC